MQAGGLAHSTDRLRYLEEDEEELLPHAAPMLGAFFATLCCECNEFPARGGWN
jgi:hypothetical protein